MKESTLRTKTFSFAVRIVKLYKFTTAKKSEFVISKQLLRAGISVGANIREAEHAESTADFIHKLSISLKEANECDYCIDLLYHGLYLDTNAYNSIKRDTVEILKILTAIIKTTKAKRQK